MRVVTDDYFCYMNANFLLESFIIVETNRSAAAAGFPRTIRDSSAMRIKNFYKQIQFMKKEKNPDKLRHYRF